MSIQDFRRDRKEDSFRGWLRTITTNKIHDNFRRMEGQPFAERGSVGPPKLAQVTDPLTEEKEKNVQVIFSKARC